MAGQTGKVPGCIQLGDDGTRSGVRFGVEAIRDGEHSVFFDILDLPIKGFDVSACLRVLSVNENTDIW